jgi:hypothetical protein
MRVRIVSYEDVNAWILGKFARKMHEELTKLGVNVDIGNSPDPTADINHHIIYLAYDEQKSAAIDTLMITHVDDTGKFNLLQRQMKVAKAGICMSRSVMNELASLGLPADRLAFINPAHDGVMKPRKMVIGITSKVQPDGCKREGMVDELFNHISPDLFSLVIMGAGWNKIVERIRNRGFTLDYYDEFNYEKYTQIVPQFDFYLYTGQDEGSMGFIDALAAGVRTIVTPQGYHLDAPQGISIAFNEMDELISIFGQIEADKRSLIDAVATWNWRDYAIKHLEIWQYLKYGRVESPGAYYDGLNSLKGDKEKINDEILNQIKSSMRTGVIKRRMNKLRNIDFLKKKLRNLFGGGGRTRQ